MLTFIILKYLTKILACTPVGNVVGTIQASVINAKYEFFVVIIFTATFLALIVNLRQKIREFSLVTLGPKSSCLNTYDNHTFVFGVSN